MPTLPSPRGEPPLDHFRIARSAILNGVTIPAVTSAVLQSRGVDVGELEQRVRDNLLVGVL